MSLTATTRRIRSRRRPRPRVSWGAAATSAGLRADRRRALAALGMAPQPERAPTELEATLELVRARLVAAGRPLLRDGARTLAALSAGIEAGGASVRAALEDRTRRDSPPLQNAATDTWRDDLLVAQPPDAKTAHDEAAMAADDDPVWSRRGIGNGRGSQLPSERRVLPRGWLGLDAEPEVEGRPDPERVPVLAALSGESGGTPPSDRRPSPASARRRAAAPRS